MNDVGFKVDGQLRHKGVAPSVCERFNQLIKEAHHEKTCLRGLRPGKTQTGLLSFRNQLVFKFWR